MFRKLLCFTLLMGIAIGTSHSAEVDQRAAAGGFANPKPEMFLKLSNLKNRKFAPNPNPYPLTVRQPNENEQGVVDQADRMFDGSATMALLLIDHGKIIYERYKDPAGPDKALFSWSMSKSLTAYTIGHMICGGNIPNIDSPAQTYSKDLEGTVYGEATVKNLLTMSSGVGEPIHDGNQVQNEWEDMMQRRLSTIEDLKRSPNRYKPFFGIPVESGTKLVYSATDTLALANIADNNGGFFDNFEKYIWKEAGTESAGYWQEEKDGRAIAQAGFSATGRDWARLAMLSIRERKSSDSCIRDFMIEATKKQLPNISRRVGKSFEGYGYQTWIADFDSRMSYWWVGFGGQRVGVDPVSERIIVLTSYREDYMDVVYRLFRQFQKLAN